ncbi:LADA_0B07822g1_1 [Lachancea dasiensis]|uniref:LADA_0B07822g1_1 n=1 Tax=Lachancea dasiensis TaxID=1072105 RepID=A0A1G4IU23_9SACH|nr:LADA_0B07822g1_1 [Lachancea dasiensis]
MRRLLSHGRHQRRGFSRACSLHQKQTKRVDTQAVDGFKDEQVSSIQEKTLFEQIFTQIMKKDEKKKLSQNVLKSSTSSAEAPTNQEDRNAHPDEHVQIVFDKKNSESVNSKLSQFFKDAVSQEMEDTGGLARMTTEDIRKYPVSLTPAYFTNKSTSNGEVRTPDISRVGGLSQSRSPVEEAGPEFFKNSSSRTSNGTTELGILRQIESKERLNATLEVYLEPHLSYLSKRIQTDGDCMAVVREYFDQYLSRDPALEAQSLHHVKEACIATPEQLPQPFKATTPFIIRYLLTNKDFTFPTDRRYALIALIYNLCKRAADVSLYLNVCNVDFYNTLIEFSWKNYQDINQLRQIVAEMTANGIMGDLNTVDLLEKIAKTMHYMNDGVVDDTENSEQPVTVGVVWCRENAQDLSYIENYMRKLKRSQAFET